MTSQVMGNPVLQQQNQRQHRCHHCRKRAVHVDGSRADDVDTSPRGPLTGLASHEPVHDVAESAQPGRGLIVAGREHGLWHSTVEYSRGNIGSDTPGP